jgi:GT2 family glycosyltransferase
MTEVAQISVVIPTIGRTESLRACLESLAQCDPRAAEVLVVDQSGGDAISTLVAEFESVGARVIRSDQRGISVGMNLALREARHDLVLGTHDDCTVDRSWVGTGWRLMAGDPEKLVSGRVLPYGDPRATPSTKDRLFRHDFTGELVNGVLYPNNMALYRPMVVAFGGFDERFDVAAEDNDLCYRWLRAGHRLHYEPELLVWHHDIRSHEELERLYVGYGQAQGKLYAKHLRRGDLRMLYFIAQDVSRGLRGMAVRALLRRPRWADERPGILRGVPGGLVTGWRLFRDDRRPRERG